MPIHGGFFNRRRCAGTSFSADGVGLPERMNATCRLVSLGLCLVAVVATGCRTVHDHVEIPPAPTDGGFDERGAYFKTHQLQSKEVDHLFLHGGTRVFYPEDLRPAVADASPAAKAMDEHVAARTVIDGWMPWYDTFSVVGGVGGGVMLAGTLGFFLPVLSPELSDAGAYVVLGGVGAGGALMIGALGGILALNAVLAEEITATAESADRAWRTYPQSLQDNVDVGVDANGLLFDLRRGTLMAPRSRPSPRRRRQRSDRPPLRSRRGRRQRGR